MQRPVSIKVSYRLRMPASEQIQISRIIDAPAARIFALLADPARHATIDSSGTLRGAQRPCLITGVGDRFIMNLYADDLGDYQSQSTVTSYEPDRIIGWAPGPVDAEPFGHTYTYILTPDRDDRTKVTQTYDWSAITDQRLRRQCPRVSHEQLARTLDLLAAAIPPSNTSQ